MERCTLFTGRWRWKKSSLPFHAIKFSLSHVFFFTAFGFKLRRCLFIFFKLYFIYSKYKKYSYMIRIVAYQDLEDECCYCVSTQGDVFSSSISFLSLSLFLFFTLFQFKFTFSAQSEGLLFRAYLRLIFLVFRNISGPCFVRHLFVLGFTSSKIRRRKIAWNFKGVLKYRLAKVQLNETYLADINPLPSLFEWSWVGNFVI